MISHRGSWIELGPCRRFRPTNQTARCSPSSMRMVLIRGRPCLLRLPSFRWREAAVFINRVRVSSNSYFFAPGVAFREERTKHLQVVGRFKVETLLPQEHLAF